MALTRAAATGQKAPVDMLASIAHNPETTPAIACGSERRPPAKIASFGAVIALASVAGTLRLGHARL